MEVALREESCPALEGAADEIMKLHSQAENPRTRARYKRALLSFRTWCEVQGFQPLPAQPEVVALYLLSQRETMKPSSLGIAVAAIGKAHELAGAESPTTDGRVRQVMRDIRRIHGVRPRRVRPLLAKHVAAIVSRLPWGTNRAQSLRDRAIVCLGVAAGLRCGELIALDVEDIEFRDDRVNVLLRSSKTDQESAGRTVRVFYVPEHPEICPGEALRAWLKESRIQGGAVFRAVNKWGRATDRRLSYAGARAVLKRLIASINLEASEFSTHSMRRGHVSEARRHGAQDWEIQDATGHKDRNTLSTYFETEDTSPNSSAFVWRSLNT